MKIHSYFIFLLSLFIIPSVHAAQDLDYCLEAAKGGHVNHVRESELRFGQSEELRKETITKLERCLTTNAVCVVGIRKTSSGSKSTLWYSKLIGETLIGNYSRTTDDVLAAAYQYRDKSNRPTCIAASRLLVRASPWWVKGWKLVNERTQTNKKLSYYAGYTLHMSPGPLVKSLAQSAKHWEENF